LAISLGIKRLLVYGDSLLVIQQVNKEWDCNKETMDAYVQEVRKLENKFFGLEVHHMIREHNVGADILSKLGSTRAQVPAGVFIQELKQPSIKSSPQKSSNHICARIKSRIYTTDYQDITTHVTIKAYNL
jgi:ribonuclease HI